jgi:chromosome segregation ATPase
LTTLRDEIKSLKQSCNAGESRIVQLETENVKIKEDRDRQKLANSNLEQTLHQTKVQLQSTEKEKRLLNNDTERNLERKARMAEEDAEAARQRCRTLEEQLKSAQASDRFHDTGRGSDSDAKVLSLQSQVNALTTSLQQYQTSSPASIRAGGPSRRPRSSSMSGSSSSAIHAMKESLDETTKEVEQWRTRATKAEREALQASNEKLAHSRLTNTTIADLRSQVADLKDELSFQRDNTLKNLEDEVRSLRGDSVKAATLGVDLTAARSSITQQEAALKAAQETIDTMQGTADQLQAELKRSKEDAVQMKEQLVIAEQISNLLQRRDREIASAQKRIRKLTVALRKIFMSMTNGQAAGDETQSQSMLVMDESSFAIVANSNEYEANWTDELDQLVGYVDEAESRVEFARIEKDIRESNAASRLQELEKIIRAKEEELVLITKDRDCCMDEQEITQARLRETESKKAEVDLKLQDALEKIQNISSDSAVLQENIESLRHELSAAERDLKSNAEDKLAMFHTVSDLKQSQEEIRKQLAESEADTLRAQIDSRSLQGRITSLTEELQALQSRLSTDEQERDGLMRQVHELESHKDSLASQYNEARDTIDKLEQRYQEVELRAASLALESHQMELRLCEEVRQSSQQQADLLEKSSEALHMEGEQWKGLVAELRDEVKQSLLQLQMKERIWIEEADCYSTQVAALETQVNMAREELQERNAQIDVLQLDLQAERTNQQLAEDALKRLVPGRENDLTVVEDASMLDASNEVYELRLQLDQARDALESSKRKQSARESDLAVAMEDAEELRAEVDKLEMQLSEALREKHDVATQGQDLQAKLAAAEHLNREVEVSMAHLNENLSSTMRQLAATQNTVGELEGSVQALETEKNDQMQQFEAAKEELREAQEGYSQLKEMMESRNAEYWETKEELAEWQERFERSQNDVKIKDEIEERLRDAMTELQDSKALAEEYLAKCTALQDSLIAAQKEIEET